ncbi:MAG: EamA family transporter [Candidatus Nanopelagicales bacterium]|jgi:drug/metabolite transporter (DMT)-like permease
MGALLALVSSVAWGSADVAGGLGARRVGSVRVIAVNYPAGAVILTIFALLIVPGTIDRTVILLSLATAVFGTIGMILLYAALALGPMGIVSPLTAIGGAAVPVAVGVLRGEPLTLLFALGAALALVSVVLVSRESGQHARITPRALLLSAGAGLAIGLFLTALGIAPEGSGVWAATLSRWWSTIGMVFVALYLIRRSGIGSWQPYPWLFAIGAGGLDAIANGLFQLAAQDGELAVVAVIGSLYPATTLLIAHFMLKERMSLIQWSGVALALGAVVALTV